MATDKERAAAAAAANSPDQAERPGAAAVGRPPERDLQSDFSPAQREDAASYSQPATDKAAGVPGFPDDLAASGGYVHGEHSFVPQSTIDRETGSPVQRTVCAVCGAELVDA